MNTLTNMNNFPIGNSLDGINIISEEISTLSLLVDGTNSMLSDLNMDFHSIKNLDAGVEASDAVNKSQLDLKADKVYVDSSLNLLRAYTDTSLNNFRIYTDASLNLKANLSYVDSSLNNLRTYVDTSLNNFRIYTDASLNLKANLSYVDASLNLKANLSYVDASLNLKANLSYVDASLNLKANLSYVDASLNLKANLSYVDSSLNTLRSYTDTSLNNFRIYTDASLNLKANLSYVDSSLNTLRSYTDTSLNNFRIYTDASLNLKANLTYVDSSLNLLRAYTDTSLNNFRIYTDASLNLKANLSYVDSSLNTLRSYTDASLNLKVNKAGDTMTNFLELPEIRLQGQTTTYNSGTIDLANRTNTYAVFESAGAVTDWAFLRQIGGSNDIHLSLDFHDDDLDGKFSLRNVVSTANPDTIKPFFTSSPLGTIINNPSTGTTADRQLALRINNDQHNGLFFHTNLSPGSWNGLVDTSDKGIIFSDGTVNTGNLVIGPWGGTKGIKINGVEGNTTLNKNASNNISMLTTGNVFYELTSGNVIYDYLTYTSTGAVAVFLPETGSSDTSMVNRVVNVSFISTINVEASPPIGNNKIIINGTLISSISYFNTTGTKLQITGGATIGTYTVSYYNWELPTNTDQLVLKSNLGTNSNSEYTGIKFLNSNTDAGFIRVDSGISHTDANMAFNVRQSGSIINPLTLNSSIIANVPIHANEPINATKDIVITGATSNYKSDTVDVANRTNTYLTLLPAGSVNDFAYLRQIGGDNDFHLAYDIHDNAVDGKVSFRTVESVANPDNFPNTWFKVTSYRGFFNPGSVLVRNNTDNTAVNLDNHKGVTTVKYNGTLMHGDLTLPTPENGVRIEVINGKSTNLKVKVASGAHLINGGINNVSEITMGNPEMMVLIFFNGVWEASKWNTESF
jgi:hypothetical protein